MSSLLGTRGLEEALREPLPTWGLTDSLKEFLAPGGEMWAERLELCLLCSSSLLSCIVEVYISTAGQNLRK